MSSSDDERRRLIATLTEAGGRLRVRSALNPILWLCGVVALPCIVAVTWSKEPPIAVTVVLYAVVGTALFGFLWFLVRDPDRLQSEDYLLRNRTLELIEEKGTRKAIDAAMMQVLAKTDFFRLEDSLPEEHP